MSFVFHTRHILIEKKNKVYILIKAYNIICERSQNWIIILYSAFKSKFIKKLEKNWKKNQACEPSREVT